jgi:tetratricopeptide (TPR) repeat protein
MERPPDEDVKAMLNGLFRESVEAAQAGRLEEAAGKLETILATGFANPGALWNLGTLRSQLQQHDRALKVWEGYRRLAPEDWRARPKVIQACQALGDGPRVEREREELLALRRAGAPPELAAEPHYCREQFRVGDRPVVAYEHFDPAGPQRVFYAFLVGNPDGTMAGRYSLGSYDYTTEFARESGQIGPDERYYHLDWYAGPLHSTQGFYTFLPGYEKVRADVVAALTGAAKPASPDGAPAPEARAPADRPDAARPAPAPQSAPPRSAPPSPSGSPPPSKPLMGGLRGDDAPASLGERVAGWARRLLRGDDRLE